MALALVFLRHKTRNELSDNVGLLERCASTVKRGNSCFFDCAVFFTFSIQLASIVVLARLDFGVSANGMGDSTAKITWAISLLTMLPLLYTAFNPGLFRDSTPKAGTGSQEQTKQGQNESLRLLLFALCWLLFIYPFLSRMIETFGPSMIGGHNAVISTSEWDEIGAVCTTNVSTITSNEEFAMEFFAVAGSIFVCFLGLTKIVWLALRRHHRDSRLVLSVSRHFSSYKRHQTKFQAALFILTPIIAISQLWTIFRLRELQQQISHQSGNHDSDGQWTFGQIIAVTIFVPALVECWFAWFYD